MFWVSLASNLFKKKNSTTTLHWTINAVLVQWRKAISFSRFFFSFLPYAMKQPGLKQVLCNIFEDSHCSSHAWHTFLKQVQGLLVCEIALRCRIWHQRRPAHMMERKMTKLVAKPTIHNPNWQQGLIMINFICTAPFIHKIELKVLSNKSYTTGKSIWICMLKISIGMEIKNKSILTNNNTKRLKWKVNGTEKTVLLENETHLELDWSVSHFPVKSIWNTGNFHIHN